MHRTQVIIEDWQYQALRARAEKDGVSLSALLRSILDRALAVPGNPPNSLGTIQGIGEDAGSYGNNHDRYLYGDPDSD